MIRNYGNRPNAFPSGRCVPCHCVRWGKFSPNVDENPFCWVSKVNGLTLVAIYFIYVILQQKKRTNQIFLFVRYVYGVPSTSVLSINSDEVASIDDILGGVKGICTRDHPSLYTVNASIASRFPLIYVSSDQFDINTNSLWLHTLCCQFLNLQIRSSFAQKDFQRIASDRVKPKEEHYKKELWKSRSYARYLILSLRNTFMKIRKK